LNVLLRLHAITGDERYHKAAASTLRKMALLAAQHPQAFGRLLCAADFFVGPVIEVAVIGEATDEATRAFLGPIRRKYLPNSVVMCAPGAGAEYPLLQDRAMIGGKPTVYLCENFVCKQPLTDVGNLEEILGVW
jgi:uncharacterized protein YyaL (SSP411 family)